MRVRRPYYQGRSAWILLVSAVLLVCGSRAATQPGQHDPFAAVDRALTLGQYARAERDARALLAVTEGERGTASLEAAQALRLVVRALARGSHAGLPETLALANRSVALTTQFSGVDSAPGAEALEGLARIEFERGEYNDALPLYRRALAIRSGLSGLSDIQPAGDSLADSLEATANTLIRIDRLADARTLLARALPIREAHAGDAPLALAAAVESLATLNRYSGDYVVAEQQAKRAISLTRGVAPEHPAIAGLMHLSGDIAFLSGDMRAAQRYYAEAVAIARRTLDPAHPVLALYLRKLGASEWTFGNLAEAKALRGEALAIGEQSLANCHPERASALNDVALSESYDGDYASARRRFEQARDLLERCLGTGHSLTATVIHNLANLMRQMGDLAAAERLHITAIAAWSTALGPDHQYVARGLDALAEVEEQRGQYAKARAMYERSLRIKRTANGPDHPDVAWTLTNLARVVARTGDTATALAQLDRAAAIYAKTPASDEPDQLPRLLTLRGSLESRRGRFSDARRSYQEALLRREELFGPTHPLSAESREALAAVDFQTGSYDIAFREALETETVAREHLRGTVRFLPERQAMAYAERRVRGLDLAMSIATLEPATHRRGAYDTVIRSRGVILDELAARAQMNASVDRTTTPLMATAAQARQRFANLVVRSLRENVDRALLDDALAQKENAEEALAQVSAPAHAELLRARAGIADVAQALPRGAALVSFVRYQRSLPSSGTTGSTRTTLVQSYAAFVLRADSPAEPAFVPLGPAAAMESLVRAWRTQASGGAVDAGSAADVERGYLTAAARLRRAVWDPVSVHLAGASQAFIVPDGVVNLVNIAALPARSGAYLVEEGLVLHYLSTERDLLAVENVAVAAPSALIVGGPAFGRLRAPARSSSLRAGCDASGQLRFADLPGSLREAEDVSKLWSTGANDVMLLRGTGATETALKRALSGRQVVHMATHGFFLGADCPDAAVGTRAVGGLVAAGAPRPRAPAETANPLLLSGLAFAGANRRTAQRSDQDDGILTAEEIAGLNLQGTEWVVLSACDTGLGEIRAGEGVFGLRRAFQIAGARTVIMSLWSVDDQATRAWMRALYEGRLQRHLNTADAVREASITVLRERRARGQSTHPFYWAPFVAAGDWR